MSDDKKTEETPKETPKQAPKEEAKPVTQMPETYSERSE